MARTYISLITNDVEHISSCISYSYVFPLSLFFWIVYILLGDFLSFLESPRYVGITNTITIIHINNQLSCLMFYFVHDIFCRLKTGLGLIHQILFLKVHLIIPTIIAVFSFQKCVV